MEQESPARATHPYLLRTKTAKELKTNYSLAPSLRHQVVNKRKPIVPEGKVHSKEIQPKTAKMAVFQVASTSRAKQWRF